MHASNDVLLSVSRGSRQESLPTRTQSPLALSRSIGQLARSPSLVARSVASFVCLSVEPEDAKMTGGTRSLSRRLLALNIRDDS